MKEIRNKSGKCELPVLKCRKTDMSHGLFSKESACIIVLFNTQETFLDDRLQGTWLVILTSLIWQNRITERLTSGSMFPINIISAEFLKNNLSETLLYPSLL